MVPLRVCFSLPLQNGHTILSYSKDIILQKKGEMSKNLEKFISELSGQDATPTVCRFTNQRPLSNCSLNVQVPPGEVQVPAEKSFGFVDAAYYRGIEVLWRIRQLPNMVLNV